MENLDIAFEIENYFSKNNLRNVELAALTIPEIYEHAKSLERELNNHKRENKFQGEVKDLFSEMISFISFALGLTLLNK